jgi:glycogen operon protein
MNAVGEPVRDDTFLVCFNPHHEPILFYMPESRNGGCTDWELLIDTSHPSKKETIIVKAGDAYELIPRSTVLLRRRTNDDSSS